MIIDKYGLLALSGSEAPMMVEKLKNFLISGIKANILLCFSISLSKSYNVDSLSFYYYYFSSLSFYKLFK